MNIPAILNFKSFNKTDSLIYFYKYKVPHEIQYYIKQNYKDEEKTSDLLLFFQKAFKNENLRKRDIDYQRARRFFLRTLEDRGFFNFSDDEIKYILENGSKVRPCEGVKILFPDLTNQIDINFRARSFKELIDCFEIEFEVANNEYLESDDLDKGGEYVPPGSDEIVISKINRCDPSADWSRGRLDSNQRKCVRALRNNLGQLKFRISINSYKKIIEKKLFETEFIRQTYDNYSLIPDDVNACMMLCGEYVREMQIKEMINLLDDQMKSTLDGDAKSSMVLATNLKDKTNELKNCQINIKSLQGQIHGHRTKRLEAESKYHQSLAQYINVVAEENNREKMLLAQKVYNETVLKNEIDNLSNLPNEIGEVHGISINEILGFKHYISE